MKILEQCGSVLAFAVATLAAHAPAIGQKPLAVNGPGVPGGPQNTISSDEAPAPPERGIADIVVTAQKTTQSVQHVPAAVSVIGNDRLQSLGVTNLSQISNLAPGISVVPLRTQALVFLRGVGETLSSPNADAAVATNLNGVYLPAEIAGTAFFDVDRIEVLPGPQGTLYGRNSTGGVINIASRLPRDHISADGLVELGNYNRVQVVVGIDIPVSSTLRSRTASTVVRHDGYFNNGEDDQRTTAVRETLVWEPGSQTKVTGVATYTHDGGIGSLLQNIPPLTCDARCANFDPKALDYSNRVNTVQTSLEVDQRLSNALSLTYIGGYSHLSVRLRNGLFVGPPLAPLFIRTRLGTQSHELRLSVDTGRIRGLVGLYYFDQNAYFLTATSPVPVQSLVNPFNAKSHGEAIYGQGTYELAAGFRLAGGIRYSTTVKRIDGSNSTFNATGTLLAFLPFEGRQRFDHADWKAGIEYDVRPGSLLYANVSTGFTPGGFSTAPAIIGQLQAAAFKPVTLRGYAVGLKNRFAGGRVTANLEGFYYDYKNYQVSARALNGQNIVFNAAKATIYGVQFDGRFALTPHNDFSAGATLLHAKADRLTAGAANFDGFDLPQAPRWSVNAAYQRSFDIGTHGGQLRADINFKYTSGRWAIYTHQPGSYIDANTHTDISLGFFAPSDRWSVKGFVRNLEDRVVKTQCANALPGPTGCFFEPPRTFGAAVGFKF